MAPSIFLVLLMDIVRFWAGLSATPLRTKERRNTPIQVKSHLCFEATSKSQDHKSEDSGLETEVALTSGEKESLGTGTLIGVAT